MDQPQTTAGQRPAVVVIGVVGAGTMGAGIAQVALEAGHEVVLHDVDEAALDRARDRIADGLTRRATGAVTDPGDIDDWVDARIGRLRESDVLETLGDECEIVIEAALEQLELKTTIFRTLDSVADPGAILATNTSALSVSEIAAATAHPERVIGLHFFNPAPLMRLVEVVAGEATDPVVITRAVDLVAGLGKTPVRAADSPGFIVNRVNRPFTLGALRLLESGTATIEAIDGVLRDAGFPLGPFELMDLTGIDVTYAASTAIWDRLGRPERLRPSPIQEEMIAAERLGRKTGEGFYRYANGRSNGVAPIGQPAAAASREPADDDTIRSRILDAIDEEARLVVAEGVAEEGDVDLAMRLGASHPEGPFERMRRTAAAS